MFKQITETQYVDGDGVVYEITAENSNIKDYYRLKGENRSSVIFYRTGDLYEVLSPDAETVSALFGLTLTNRDYYYDSIPMCCVPFTCIDRYVDKLKYCGFNVIVAGAAE